MSRETTTFVEGEIHDDEPLNMDEAATLGALEERIRNHMAGFVEVGKCLHEIRTKRLYRMYGTWERYLREVHPVSLTAAWANQLIAAAEVHDVVPVPTVRAAKALKAAKGDVAEVFAKAVENVGGDARRVNARVIAEADREVTGEPTESQAIAESLPPREAVYATADAANAAIDAVLVHLRESVKAVKSTLSTSDAARWLDCRGVEQDCKRIGEHLKAGRPHARCLRCIDSPGQNGSIGQCEYCKGCGWLPRFKHDALKEKQKGPLLTEE